MAALLDKYCGDKSERALEALVLLAVGKPADLHTFFGVPLRPSAKDRIVAIRELLDRRFGKAPVVVEDGEGTEVLPTIVVMRRPRA